jgi:hypothetical protein
MRRLIELGSRADRALIGGIEFLFNVHYYWRERRLPLREAIRLARVTL